MSNEKMGRKGYKKFESRADEYLHDSDKAEDLLTKARDKAGRKKGSLAKIWDKVQLLFNLLGDWAKGRYKVVPTKSIVMIIVAIVYFVFPVDLLPDFIVGLGFIDDVAVLGFVIGQIGNDLDEYAAWRNENAAAVDDKKEELCD